MPFYINRAFENELQQWLSSMQSYINGRPVNLGGASGPSGGYGGPPGGFIGMLPQTRITFDSTEASNNVIPASGASLVTNLNRIRNRITVLEQGGSGGDSNSYFMPITQFYVLSGGIGGTQIPTLYEAFNGFPNKDWQFIAQYPLLKSGDANINFYIDSASNQASPQQISCYLGFYRNQDEYYNTGWLDITVSGTNSYSDIIKIGNSVNVNKYDGLWIDCHHHIGSGTDAALVYGILITYA